MNSGIAYVVLNILRILTVLALLLTCVASVLIMAVKFPHTGDNFFSILNQVSRFFSAIIIITTETPTSAITAFYRRRCPVWTQGFSLAWSGFPILMIACSLLSNKEDEAHASTDKLSSVRKSIILSAGICLGVLGLLYCLMPLIYW